MNWPTILGIGGGTAVLLFGLFRVLAPRSTPLILWQANVAESAEFLRTANVIANVLPGAQVRAVRSIADISAALGSVHGPISPLVLVGHGTTRTFFPGFGLGPERLASLIARRLAPGAIVGLAGCRAAGDPGSADWEAAAFGPGGARSFAALLRDGLVIAGAPWGVEVRAHSTTGHASANPAIRAFPVMRSALGQAGVSGMDLLMGRGSWRDAALRRRWTNAVRGQISTLWISGYTLPGAV